DLAPDDDANAARYRHTGFVVPIDIGAHRQLALVLCRVEQLADALGVLDRVTAAGNSAADRAGLDPPSFDPDVHLGRCGDQKLALAEVDQRAVGCGIGVAQPLEDNAWRVGAGIGEELADDDLEQIAASKGGPGALDQCRIFAWAVVALVRPDGARE